MDVSVKILVFSAVKYLKCQGSTLSDLQINLSPLEVIFLISQQKH